MKIIIHAGLQKTGSTFLQHVLKKNSAILKQHGIYYQTIWSDSKNDELNSSKFRKNALQTYIDIAELNKANILLLSEECQIANIKFYEKFFEDKRYHIESFVYVRYFTSQIEKFLYQYMKDYSGYNNDYTNINYRNRRLKEHLTWPEKVNIYMDSNQTDCNIFSYEQSKNKGLFKHFLSVVGVNSDTFDINIHKGEKNITPHTYDSLFLNFIKILPLTLYEYSSFRSYILRHSISEDNNDYLLLDKDFYYSFYEAQKKYLIKIGNWLNNDNYIEESLQWLEGKEICPHRELPKEIFNEIFYKLPENLQNIVTKYIPHHHDIYDAIIKIDSGKYIPMYISQNKQKIIKLLLPQEKINITIEKYPFDKSAIINGGYLNSYLVNFQYHLSGIKYNFKYNRYIMNNWWKIYRKLICFELYRIFTDKSLISKLINDRSYSNEYLHVMLINRIQYLHREYIMQHIEKTRNKDILVFGAGEIFNHYYPYFTTHNIKSIMVDMNIETKKINNIEILYPDDILPNVDGNIPIFIFSNEAITIRERLQKKFPHCNNFITCCF